MRVEGRHGPFFLGIDLGVTNIKGGVVDDQGRPLSVVGVPTRAADGPEGGLRRLAEVGRRAVAESGLDWGQIAAVGLGSPGPMDLAAGRLLEPHHLPGWNDLPIRDRLAEDLGKPTVLQNDANAAAYGEYWAGAGRGVQSLVMFTLGTGIGGGIIDRGRIVEGRHGHGGEVGHIIVQMENARRCPCGGFGHLEAYASATALVQRAVEALGRQETTVLRRRLAEDNLTARAIHEAAEAGDPLARRLMRETARYLAVGAVSLMHAIDPDLVLFGGGLIAAGPKFLADIRADIRGMALPVPGARTRVQFAALGGDAGVIGAAGCARLAHSGSPEDEARRTTDK
jgi:glucokinase